MKTGGRAVLVGADGEKRRREARLPTPTVESSPDVLVADVECHCAAASLCHHHRRPLCNTHTHTCIKSHFSRIKQGAQSCSN